MKLGAVCKNFQDETFSIRAIGGKSEPLNFGVTLSSVNFGMICVTARKLAKSFWNLESI